VADEPLPNPDAAVLAPGKLRDYLLNPEHKEGHSKAVRFRALGFERSDWRAFERALREQHLTQPAEPAGENAFGVKYAITARLEGPSGDSVMVRSVWIIRKGEDHPRLLTAYPVRK
jgi:hypothetical protein